MDQEHRICYIVGAMPLDEGFVPHPQEGDLVIAADGGYASLPRLGLTPHLAVGDFDSLGWTPNHPALIQLPCEKDDTDMGYALKLGLERGYRRFLLLGGVGGRLDHTVANLQLLGFLAQRGAMGVLYGGGQASTVLTNGSLSFPPGLCGYCSVFCRGGTAQGVTIQGLKYPLNNATLSGDFPLGVSNEFLDAPASVSVADGSLLIVWNCNDPGKIDRFLRSESTCSFPPNVV